MTPDDLVYTSATDLAALMRAGEVSPVEVTDAVLDRIARLNPATNAYCTVVADSARAGAKEAERRLREEDDPPALLGVPISLKDNIETAGVRTTYGSRVFAEFVPAEDSVAAARFKAAGAILLGKTSLPEFAAKGVVDPPLFGHTRNPWNLERVVGGSSGGAAAAVAAGMGPIALGNDQAGSVRMPAAFCGVPGLKPSGGRIPYYPNENPWDIIFVLGPIARTVADLELVLRLLEGPDHRDPMSLPLVSERWDVPLDDLVRPWRIAWSPDLGFPAVDREVLDVVTEALGALSGAGTVDRVDLDLTAAEEAYSIVVPMRRGAALFDVIDDWEPLMDPFVAGYVRDGLAMGTPDLGRATRARSAVHAAVEAVLADYDLIVTPTVAVPPFPVGQPGPDAIDGRPLQSWRHWFPFTYPFNLTGHPAISVPAGWTSEDLPVGIQIVGHRFADRDVLAAGRYLETARPWAHRRPPEPNS